MKIVIILLLVLLFSSCATVKKLKISGVRDDKKMFRPVWTKNIDPVYNAGNLPIAYNSPLIYEDILFLNHPKGYFVAYDMKQGKELWRKDDKSSSSAAPIVHKEYIVYGTTEGRVVARHYLTGKEKYIVDVGSSVESEPLIYRERIFIHLRNHKIVAMDFSTGKILWVYKRSVPFLTTLQRVSKPLAYENKLFVGSADGYLLAFSVEDGTLLWEQRVVNGSKFVDIDNAPIMFSDKLVVSSISGESVVLDPRTGAILRKLPFISTRRPIRAKSALIFGTERGNIVLVDKNFKIINKYKIGNDPLSSIAKWRNGFAVADLKGNLRYVDGTSFKVLDSASLGHSYSTVFGKMAVEDGALAVLSSRNRLYVFK